MQKIDMQDRCRTCTWTIYEPQRQGYCV